MRLPRPLAWLGGGTGPGGGLAGWGSLTYACFLDPVLEKNLNWVLGSGGDPGLGRGPRGLWVAKHQIFYRWVFLKHLP